MYDKHNYYPMNKWVFFGHHFAAIAGAGPLVGPVLAAQFGYLPGFIWMLVGAVMAGAVHDVVILTASVRHDGKSLAEIAKDGNRFIKRNNHFHCCFNYCHCLSRFGSGGCECLGRKFVGNIHHCDDHSYCNFHGFVDVYFRKGKTVEATIIGVILLSLAVIYGKYIPGSPFESWFTYDRKTLTILLAAYGFFASVLPVWLLLSPRDYLSSIMKLAVIAMFAIGVISWSDIQMPSFTPFIHGGGPIIPGTLFPYLFITIACGAISGFHALVSSGTTPKMIMKESHIKPIAVGSMLAEGMVSILALIAATSFFRSIISRSMFLLKSLHRFFPSSGNGIYPIQSA